MEFALLVLKQVFIMLCYALVGLVAAKTKLVRMDATKSMSNMLLYCVCPFMVINSLCIDYDSEVTKGFLWSLLLAAVSMAACILLSHFVFFRKDSKMAGAERYSMAFSNVGFIGIPLLSGIFGSESVIYIASSMVIFNVVVWVYGVMVLKKGQPISVKKIFLNPGTISVAIGLVIYFCRIQLPSAVASVVSGIGNTNSFLSMFIIGLLCSQLDYKKAFTDKRALYVCLCRLVVFPLLTFGLIFWWLPGVLPVNGIFITSIVAVISCMPIALNLPMMCQICGLDDEVVNYGSNLVALSTILCVVTVPIFTMLFTWCLNLWAK